MKLSSNECKEALRSYVAQSEIEAEAIDVLLKENTSISEDKKSIRIKVSTGTNLDEVHLLELSKALLRIKRVIGID
jgi:hypothetical protein